MSLGEEFTAAGAVFLAEADIAGSLVCLGARLTGRDKDGHALYATGIKVGGNVLLGEGFTAAGAVFLAGADIAGQLACSGARLTGSEGNALAATRMKVGGDVLLDEGFTAAGAIQLAGVDITGGLACSGARLAGCDKDGYALSAVGIKVGGDVLLGEGFTARAVCLAKADIAGMLSCDGAHLTRRGKDGYALYAPLIKCENISLGEGFTAGGAISLSSARLSGSLGVMPTRLAGNEEDTDQAEKVSLDASHAQITGVLRWQPAEQVRGQVSLQGVAVGELADDWSDERADANGYWPSGGRLNLDGFTYDRFGAGPQASVKQRLAWIRSQYRRSAPDPSWHAYAPQPYEQLAAVYRQAGQDAQARQVAIARSADLRKYGNLSRYRRFGDWFLDKTIKYGYQTWRPPAAGLAVLYCAFWLLATIAQHTHAIVPVGNIEGLNPVPSATTCASNYPCFVPAGYAVNVVVPLINVRQAQYWCCRTLRISVVASL